MVVFALGAVRHEKRQRISEILVGLVGDCSGHLSLGEVVTALGDRGYGLLIFVLALPNMIPVYIPGLSAVFGIPLAMIALQMMLGMPRPWLPAALLQRRFRRQEFANLTRRLLPWLLRLERALKPRWLMLTSPTVERAIGLIALILALLLALPIPLTGIPISAGLLLMGVGLIERDGLVLLGGVAAGILAFAYSGLATLAVWESALALWAWIFG